jgi:hypothetical protein
MFGVASNAFVREWEQMTDESVSKNSRIANIRLVRALQDKQI